MAETCLYRFYDDADRLLYVGISKHALVRLSQHLREKPWAREIVRTTLEWFPDRVAAAAAEVVAILGEHPRYNIVHNAPPSPRRPLRRDSSSRRTDCPRRDSLASYEVPSRCDWHVVDEVTARISFRDALDRLGADSTPASAAKYLRQAITTGDFILESATRQYAERQGWPPAIR